MPTELTLQSLTLPAAPLGGENPLTPLRSNETASAAGARAGDADYPDRGPEDSILPYRLQDQYTRTRQPTSFKTVVLENEHLRATFLPDVGGRLWSLIHKPTHRELLFVNPVFQPANLAVRDAWFSGGVEWNISIIGHSPFTCAPLFAARVLDDDGNPVLRLYEWDRIRRAPFQIDCWLSDDKPFLFVRVRIINPHDYPIPMYWWSNIAIPEKRDVRVLGPSDQAYRHDYDGSLVEHSIPYYEGTDVTYTTNRRWAADMYFRIPPGQRPWIAALDGEGRGLLHTSTDRLIGRKMFNWGVAAGGERWQSFLSEPGQAYIEIQGGLTPTQGEYLAMPAGAKWSWLEAYGLLEAPPREVHSDRWSSARQSVENELERRLPRNFMNAQLDRSQALSDRAPYQILHSGSGWGALERIRRESAGEKPFVSPALPFPDTSIDAEQKPWLTLLQTGELPSRLAVEGPGSLMVQPEWRDLLEKSAAKGGHWLTWYHLGVMRYRAGDASGAREAWQRSLQEQSNPWASRDLAVLARDQGDRQQAAILWLAASRQAPDVVPLVIEAAKALLQADRPADMIAFADAFPPAVRVHGRIRLLRAVAALATGDLDLVERYFQGDVDIANIRESETSLSDLWFGWQEQRVSRERGGISIDENLRQLVHREFPPPPAFDFRLNPTQ